MPADLFIYARSYVAVLAVAFMANSCLGKPPDRGLQSITSRLIGHHVNLSNALSRLAERGVLTASDLREILDADRAWFRERSRVEAQLAMDGRRLGADVKETERLLRNQRHGNGGNFRGKQLTWANLTQSTGAEQDLSGFQMDGADFTGLRQPGFLGSYLREDGTVVLRSYTDLRMANMLGAEMHSKLAEADMRFALLIGVDFTNANLRSTILWNADLRWVDFSGADLTGSEVDWADLKGANYEPAAGGIQSYHLSFRRRTFR